jgi:hypothetical protein
MVPDPSIETYQVHVWIRQISPMFWRRLLVHSDSTLAPGLKCSPSGGR